MDEINLANEVWSETQLCELLNIKPVSMDNLRLFRGLPYVPVGRGRRVYLSRNVLAWLAKQEKASVPANRTGEPE